MQIITSLSASTANTGYTPPERALLRRTTSGQCIRALRIAACPSDRGPNRTLRLNPIVAREQDVVRRAQLAGLAKVSCGRDDDPRLPMNRFDKECRPCHTAQALVVCRVNLTISDGPDRIATIVLRTHSRYDPNPFQLSGSMLTRRPPRARERLASPPVLRTSTNAGPDADADTN
jgi:hypothetical protein